MNIIKKIAALIFTALFIAAGFGFEYSHSQIIDNDPSQLRGVDIEEHLNDYIPVNLQFIDDHGDSVNLGDYFNNGKPVVLMMGYYECPMLCNLVMNGIAEAVKETSLKFGEDYQIVSVTIDPRETDFLASAKKENYLKQIGDPEDHDGWAFLTGGEEQSQALADAVGFKYYYDESKDQYAHPAVLTILTEDGKISRYLYGVRYESKDFKLAILEASQGKVGNTLDRVLLYCYHYDPDAGGYAIFAENVMKLGGSFTLVLLAGFLGVLWFRDKRKKSDKKTNGRNST